MLPTESTSSALNTNMTTTSQHKSVATVQTTPQFMGGLPLRQLPNKSSHTAAKRPADDQVEQVNGPVTKRSKQEIQTESPAIKYEGFHGKYHADPSLNAQTTAHDGQVPEPTSHGASLMDLAPETRLKILSYHLSNIARPSETISINPRAKLLSDPMGDFEGYDCKGETKWQARRGVLQACHQLREEALEVLYHESTFFARMTQIDGEEVSFERLRFLRWLKSLGDDAEACRVRKVTFGIEWTTVRGESGAWWRRRGQIHIAICRGKVTVEGSARIADCPAAPLRQIEDLLEELMVGKAVGEGLYCDEWMGVWDTVQGLMKSGWGSPY